MQFYTGLHQPSDAKHFERSFISINRLRGRRSGFEVADWILDSGAFTEISKHGHYRNDPKAYAHEIKRWVGNGNLKAAVSQDLMCEPHILAITGLTVQRHQELTIERYDSLNAEDLGGAQLIPVLQGFAPRDYVTHLQAYAGRLLPGMWTGVGSVCKRNSDPQAIWEVLDAIKQARPDLRLHGFGLKATALALSEIQQLLHSSDSMAWSFHARMHRRNGNDWREARKWTDRIQHRLALGGSPMNVY